MSRTVTVSDRPASADTGSGAAPPSGLPVVPPATQPPPPAKVALSPKLQLSASRRSLSAMLRHGLIVRAAGNFAGGLVIRIRIVRVATASSAASKTVTLGLRPHSTRVRLGRAARKRLTGARGVVLTIDGVLTDRAGHRAAAHTTLHLHG